MAAVASPVRQPAEVATPAWWIGLDAGHRDNVRAERDALRIADTLLPAASTVCVHTGEGGRVLLSYELADDSVPSPDQLARLVLDEGAGVTIISADGCIDVALGDIGRRTTAAIAAKALLLRADGAAVRYHGADTLSGVLSAGAVLLGTAIERLDAGGEVLSLSSTVIVDGPVVPSFQRGLLTLSLERIGDDCFRPLRQPSA